MNAAIQTWDPETYARNARFVSDLGAPVFELLAPKAGERILDLGCGDGVLTAKLVEAGAIVVAVDSSEPQVRAAHALGLDARLIDGQALAFGAEFDAVFSNAALHWMKRADDVIAGVWQSLKPGGRFVGEMGGHGCVAAIRVALTALLAKRGVDANALTPWYFPTVDDYGVRLRARGFRVDSIALIPRPTPLPGDMNGWVETFAGVFIAKLPETDRAGFIGELRDTLRPILCDSAGRWTADYTRLRFAATKPAIQVDSLAFASPASASP